MKHRGFSHIGLSTLDLDKTRAFYERVLGFKAVDDVTVKIEEGGCLRHLFFDVGGGQRWLSRTEQSSRYSGKIRCGDQWRARCSFGLLSFCFRGRVAGRAGAEARRAAQQGRRDHRHH
jgi:catechol 2,3-dioxygenase-like lactoylglutathione lyase family enzyme